MYIPPFHLGKDFKAADIKSDWKTAETTEQQNRSLNQNNTRDQIQQKQNHYQNKAG